MPRPKVNFRGGGAFSDDLKQGFDNYYSQEGVKQNGYRELHRKAAVVVLWAAIACPALILFASNWWEVVLLGLNVVLALIAVEFNVMHDGNHGAFSRHAFVNNLAGFSLEFLGGSSPGWQVSHNVAHHTWTNIDQMDEDINAPPFARLASTQEYRPWYRWQHLYLWLVYGFVTLRWQVWGDFVSYKNGRIGCFELKRRGYRGFVHLLTGKLLFFGWALALPMWLHWSLHGVAMVLLVFLGLSFLFSFVVTLTFQAAHCNDEAMFTTPELANETLWKVHEVQTTQNFSPDNRALRWLLGGLNFQIEHHLYPWLPHVHYPRIYKMVRAVCERHGLQYHCQPTLWAAVRSHYRHLREMGEAPKKPQSHA